MPKLIFNSSLPPLIVSEWKKQCCMYFINILHVSLIDDLQFDKKIKEYHACATWIRKKYGEDELKSILNNALYTVLFATKISICYNSRRKIAVMLINKGADINGQIQIGSEKGTLLLFAVQFQRWELLDKLISKGADISVITQNVLGVLLAAFKNKQCIFFNKLIGLLTDSACRSEGPDLLQKILRSLPKEFEREIMAYLIQLFCDMPLMYGSIDNLKFMYEGDRELFRSVVHHSVNSEYRDFLKKAMDAGFSALYKYISPFSCGRGKIDYEAGLTACAAISSTKNQEDIQFTPTVLNGNDELQEYFEFIENNLYSMNNQSHKFIVSSEHWVAGVIEMKDDKPSIFFVDSLGEDSYYLEEPVEIAMNVFDSGNISTEPRIIIAKQKRQSAPKGCSVFALDDVRRLFKRTELSSDLNPSMLRTTESLKIIANEKKHPEKIQQYAKPVNKLGKLFDESLSQHLKPDPDDPAKTINTRIDYKLQKLCEKVTKFVSNKSEDQIEEAKRAFSLDSFRVRISTMKLCRTAKKCRISN